MSSNLKEKLSWASGEGKERTSTIVRGGDIVKIDGEPYLVAYTYEDNVAHRLWSLFSLETGNRWSAGVALGGNAIELSRLMNTRVYTIEVFHGVRSE